MSIRKTLGQVVAIFNQLPNYDIATESKSSLEKAANIINELLNITGLTDEELKKKSDLIIAGAILYAMAIHDQKYVYRYNRDDSHIYSIAPEEVFKDLTNNMPFADTIYHIGARALTKKELPFTGVFDQTFGLGCFSALQDVLKENHFNEYQLNKNSAIMDPSDINRLGKERKRQEAERKEAQRLKDAADKKWARPFSRQNVDSLFARSQFNEQEQLHSAALWKWRGYVVLSVTIAPFTLFTSLAFTIPWLQKKHEEIQTNYKNKTWVKTEFTLEQYNEIIDLRTQLKNKFGEENPVEKDPNKPRKICIGFDAHGNQTTERDRIRRVVMLSDKAQAKRWSPAFLREATATTYKATIEESVSYHMAQQG